MFGKIDQKAEILNALIDIYTNSFSFKIKLKLILSFLTEF